VCSSLQLQSHYGAHYVQIYSYNHTTVQTVFQSTAAITLQYTVCFSLQLQSHYSEQFVPVSAIITL